MGIAPPPIAGLLLAAGEGRRYGRPKALVEQDGRLWVERAAETLTTSGCSPVVVVLGAASETVRDRAELPESATVDNPDWPTGMGSSLRRGLNALTERPDARSVVAAVVLLVDTPGITADAVRRVAAAATPETLATATYAGRRGHPVVLGRAHWAGIARTASGDVGARAYLREHATLVQEVPCDDVADGTDHDVPPE